MKMVKFVQSSHASTSWIKNSILRKTALMLMCLAACQFTGAPMASAAEGPSVREELDFNRDWIFGSGQQDGAEAVEYDDSGWEAVRLPHDWAIAGPFDPEGNGSTGKLPWQGVGWYRKSFSLDTADAGKRVYLNFDGVMAFPKVYINGQLAGEWDYGYTPFWIDATEFVKFGETNVIAVSVDTTQHRSRWYPGAGIYRDVKLVLTDPIHIEHWGTFVTTPIVSDEIANVKVRNTVENHRDEESLVDIEVSLYDPAGNEIIKRSSYLRVPANGKRDIVISFPVHDPQIWDVASPHLYQAKTTIQFDGEVVDDGIETFGIRSFEFTPNDGFHLNGRRVQLQGVCLHHDLGPLGAAFNLRAMERQLEIMHEMGVNAVRTAHNPSARGLVELCDRMGIVVVNEAFDKWDGTADRVDGAPPLEEHGRRHLSNLVKRDRNSPSVIMWSIGNEIGNNSRNRAGDGKDPESVTFMSDIVREYDPSRPITLGCHTAGTAMEPILDSLDVVGYNYGRRYQTFREQYPHVPLYYSESASTVSSRDYYSLPQPSHKTDYERGSDKVSSYDLTATSWSDIPDVEFFTLMEDDFLAGEFVWTGFDYLGEPTPIRGARSSYFGIVDLCGIPKDRYYLYRSQWRPEETTVHILPHWNWPDRTGENVPVFVYTNGDSAELFLNGESLDKRTKTAEIRENKNLIAGKTITTSSQREENSGRLAIDGESETSWRADAEGQQWLQADLGRRESIRYISVNFARAGQEEENSGSGRRRRSAPAPAYSISVSDDGQSWQELVASQPEEDSANQGGGGFGFGRQGSGTSHEVETTSRFVRIEFTSSESGANGISELEVNSMTPGEEYYQIVDRYRLRWNDVTYAPGELRAIAYKNGSVIGEATVETAGDPATIRLTPDRREISADGVDLSYILVEMVDAEGNVCPLADSQINFSIDGPLEIAGVGSGDQNSLEPYQADFRKLFYGKAMLIVRSVEGESGEATITASSEGVSRGIVTVKSQ